MICIKIDTNLVLKIDDCIAFDTFILCKIINVSNLIH
jgi:hypothetical protein